MYNPIDSFARVTGFNFIPGVNWFLTESDFIKFLASDIEYGVFGENIASCIPHYRYDARYEHYLREGKANVDIPSRLSIPLLERKQDNTLILRSIAVLIYDPSNISNDAFIIRMGDQFTVDFIFHTFSIITEANLPRQYKVMFSTVSIQNIDNYHQQDNLSEFIAQHHNAQMNLTKMKEFYLGLDVLTAITQCDGMDSFSQIKSWVYYIPSSELAIGEKQAQPTILISCDVKLVTTSDSTLCTSEDIRSYIMSTFNKSAKNLSSVLWDFNYACNGNLPFIGNTMLCIDASTVPSVFVIRDEIIFSSEQTDEIHWSHELTKEQWKEKVAEYINNEGFISVYDNGDGKHQIHLEFYRSHRAQQFIPTLPSEKMSEIVDLLPYPDSRCN